MKELIGNIRRVRIMSIEEYKKYEESLILSKGEKVINFIFISFIILTIVLSIYWIKLDNPSRNKIKNFVSNRISLFIEKPERDLK